MGSYCRDRTRQEAEYRAPQDVLERVPAVTTRPSAPTKVNPETVSTSLPNLELSETIVNHAFFLRLIVDRCFNLI